jgi:succinate dehydrogenase/fumarate reductase-like Fe-S protein
VSPHPPTPHTKNQDSDLERCGLCTSWESACRNSWAVNGNFVGTPKFWEVATFKTFRISDTQLDFF